MIAIKITRSYQLPYSAAIKPPDVKYVDVNEPYIFTVDGRTVFETVGYKMMGLINDWVELKGFSDKIRLVPCFKTHSEAEKWFEQYRKEFQQELDMNENKK